MFEVAELGQKVSKQDFAKAEMELRTALLEAQRQLRGSNRSVVVIVSGVEGARKSEVVNRLCEWLDPRGVHTHAFWDETEEERARPRFWRFWRSLPPRGTIGVMFGSWYTQPIIQRAFGQLDDPGFEHEMRRCEDLERTLAADGTIFCKLWFHLSREAQSRVAAIQAPKDGGKGKKGKKAKEKARKKEKKEAEQGKNGKNGKAPKAAKAAKKGKGKKGKKGKKGWKLSPLLEEFSPLYDVFARVSEAAIRYTDTAHAPWHIVESVDSNYRDLSAGRILLNALQKGLTNGPPVPAEPKASVEPALAPGAATVLDGVDLSRELEPDDYKAQLKHAQARVNELAWGLRNERRSVVAVFEGWDAAGKGGAIRRCVAPIDARLYRVIPIAAPTDEERAQHYLWRFWRHIPMSGTLRIFDRSWYGRVLVERVEGFAPPEDWLRSYHEINSFESQLAEHGIGVAKFWIHISPEEQLRRFEERGKIAWKQHKITDEDWRNREKWPDYVEAIDDMVKRTSTFDAPWTLVSGNDKRVARVQIVSTLADTMEKTLGR